MKKPQLVVLWLILSLFLVSFSYIGEVKAQDNTIYIRADGTVEGTDKIQREGNIYTFTGNIINEINVERSNIVIDGANFSLQSSFRGIVLTSQSSVTIKNIKIEIQLSRYGYAFGIVLTSSFSNTIINNEIIVPYNLSGEPSLLTGILLDESSNNKISNNTITSLQETGIQLSESLGNTISNNKFNGCGISVVDSAQNTVFNNTVNEKPLVYLENISDFVVEKAGQIILVNCNNITVTNFVLPIIGIQLLNTKNSVISKNQANLFLYESSRNVISENTGEIEFQFSDYNTVSKNNWWIELYNSSNNVVSENKVGIKAAFSVNLTLMYNEIGPYSISLQNTVNSLVESNKITGNESGEGIVLSFSFNNTIINNIIEKHTFGIYLRYSGYNIIYGNNFIDNEAHVVNLGSPNIWDNGTAGNYWSDYLNKYPNATSQNGIWDIPYQIIDSYNLTTSDHDNFPLASPVDIETIPEFPSWTPFLISGLIATFLMLIIYRQKIKEKRK